MSQSEYIYWPVPLSKYDSLPKPLPRTKMRRQNWKTLNKSFDVWHKLWTIFISSGESWNAIKVRTLHGARSDSLTAPPQRETPLHTQQDAISFTMKLVLPKEILVAESMTFVTIVSTFLISFVYVWLENTFQVVSFKCEMRKKSVVAMRARKFPCHPAAFRIGVFVWDTCFSWNLSYLTLRNYPIVPTSESQTFLEQTQPYKRNHWCCLLSPSR